MEDAGPTYRVPNAIAKLALACLFAALALLPWLLVPAWLRVLSTALFVAMVPVVLRAYLATILSFRRFEDPPAKPADAPWPTVSVLVPAFNEAVVLERTIASMRKVDYPADRIEFVYVLEERCDDGTNEIVRAHAKADARFRPILRAEGGGGKAAATNHGLPYCRGEIVVSLDADHELEPGAVKRAVQWFLADPTLACLKGRAVGRNASESWLAFEAKVERDIAEKGDIYSREVARGFTLFGGGQAVFRKSVFDALGDFDEEILVEDIDFSVRLHQAGLRLRVDPGFVTYEENPASWAAWSAQRKRWARGWMQVAVRYLPRIWSMPLTWRQRLDMTHTLTYVIVPTFLLLAFPLAALSALGFDARPYGVDATPWVWWIFLLAPAVMSAAVAAQDVRQGLRRRPTEIVAAALLWPYLVLQSTIYWSAFVDEFILRRPAVYVRTTKSGHGAAADALRSRSGHREV